MTEAVRSLRPGDHAKVRPHEKVEVRVLTALAAGYILSIDLPRGVRLIEQIETPPKSFGGQAEIIYLLECEQIGVFRITFTQRRPWTNVEDATVLILDCDH